MPSYQGQEPTTFDATGRPLYVVQKTDTTQYAPTPGQSSNINSKPESSNGQNFDPKIRAQYANEPNYTHARRPMTVQERTISPELQQKNEESKKKYPFLNLSPGEYVILMIKRHPIGIAIPIGVTSVMALVCLVLIFTLPNLLTDSGVASEAVPAAMLAMVMLFALVLVGGYISVWVYLRNTFFLTNESIIQELQHSLFSHREQTVSLGSIEDASYKRNGLLQTLLDYGTIRLSTEGEETTYRFHYVANPKEQVARLHNAIEDFKNGRAVRDID